MERAYADSRKRLASTLCPPDVADAIEELRDLLVEHYGVDFAFVVAAHGFCIGASSAMHGVIQAHAIPGHPSGK